MKSAVNQAWVKTTMVNKLIDLLKQLVTRVCHQASMGKWRTGHNRKTHLLTGYLTVFSLSQSSIVPGKWLMENRAIFQKLKATSILKMFLIIFLTPKKIQQVNHIITSRSIQRWCQQLHQSFERIKRNWSRLPDSVAVTKLRLWINSLSLCSN